jgi:hypothetical protein
MTTLSTGPSDHRYTDGWRYDITNTDLHILNARDALTGLARAQFDDTIICTQQSLLALAEDIQEQKNLPASMPERARKPGWARAASKANNQLTAGAEALQEIWIELNTVHSVNKAS